MNRHDADSSIDHHTAASPSPHGKDRTPWPHELMHAELCATRFGMNATCDCGKDAESHV